MAIPKYTKWLPAITPLYFYAINSGIAAITTPLTNAFNAVGKIGITTKLMIMWTILTWLFYPVLSYQYGYIGTAAATLIVGSSSVVVWIIGQKVFNLNVYKSIKHPLLASIIVGVALYIVSQIGLNPLLSIGLKILIGFSIYFSYQLLFTRQELVWFWQQLVCFLPKK